MLFAHAKGSDCRFVSVQLDLVLQNNSKHLQMSSWHCYRISRQNYQLWSQESSLEVAIAPRDTVQNRSDRTEPSCSEIQLKMQKDTVFSSNYRPVQFNKPTETKSNNVLITNYCALANSRVSVSIRLCYRCSNVR